MCIRDRYCIIPKIRGNFRSVPIERLLKEAEDLVAQGVKAVSYTHLDVYKRQEHTEAGADIVPITKIAQVHLDDLVGYEIAKKKLIENLSLIHI